MRRTPAILYIGLALAAGLLVLIPGLAAVTLAEQQPVREVHLVRRPSDPDRPLAFAPAEVTVRPGTTVRWINDADVFHTVTFTDSLAQRVPNGIFDSTLAAAGQTTEFRFDAAGLYFYYCQPHSQFMTGMVRVSEGAGGEGRLGSAWWAGGVAAVALMILAAAVWRHGRIAARRPES
ncbi:MAG: plastocyanin/azurin family copper-binding protein [Dehalococcoidia bacterium]